MEFLEYLFITYFNTMMSISKNPICWAVSVQFVIDTIGISFIFNYGIFKVAVAEWYGAGLCDREDAGSTPAGGCFAPTPTRRAIHSGSVNEYQRKLGSKRAYHAMH